MSGEAWDMRSNIKGKPGSQGTLFQPRDKDALLNPQQRWPKGYTPERAAEVRRALPYVQAPEHLEAGKGTYEPGDYRGEFGYKETHVLPVIARSTVPVEHLAGLTEIHGYPDKDTHGTYWPKTKQLAVDMTEKDSDRTLIHELGHHADFTHNALGSSEHIEDAAMKYAVANKSPFHEKPTESGVHQGRSRVETGVREAVADNYVTEHLRTPGRNPKKVDKGAYEKNFPTAALDREYPGYTDVRPPHLGPQFDTGQPSLLRVTAGNNVRLF